MFSAEAVSRCAVSRCFGIILASEVGGASRRPRALIFDIGGCEKKVEKKKVEK